MIDPYRKMRTAGFAEKPIRPIVYAWCVRVNINANRCMSALWLAPVANHALLYSSRPTQKVKSTFGTKYHTKRKEMTKAAA